MNPLFSLSVIIGCFFVLISLYFWLSEKQSLSLVSLILAGFLFRLFSSCIDPFLNTWDEQFHALIARNISDGHLVPLLYKEPLLDYDFRNWSANHVWLHKQPLFLWTIAFSVKIFGNAPFAIRLPGLLLSTAIIPLVFLTGKNFLNKNVGFFAALLYTTSFFNINFISGQTFTDHNDIFFTCFVTGSIWAYSEYYVTKNRKWLLMIGLFCGLAVMVKWLVGLLIFGAWFIHVLFDKTSRIRITSYLDIIYSFAASLLIFIPWQIYAYVNFPAEYEFEYSGMINHFFKVVEGHGGGYLYHVLMLPEIYGWTLLTVGLISILLFLYRKKFHKVLFLFIYIFLTYAFFTLAATKMPAFTLISFSAFYIVFGFAFNEIHKKATIMSYLSLRIQKLIFALLMTAVCFINLRPFSLFSYHSIDSNNQYLKEYRLMKLHNTSAFKEVCSSLPEGMVLLNCNYPDNIELMFYGDIVAYPFIPSEDQFAGLKRKTNAIGVFDGKLPDYIRNDPDVIIVKKYICKQPGAE